MPEKCINDRGLVVKETRLEWVPLNAQRVHSSVQSVETKIDATGKMTGKLVLQRKEYAASQFRGNANDDNDIEKYLAEFAKINMLTVNSKEINNVAQANLPVLINVAFSNQTSIVNGDEIFVQPMFLSSIKENPYKLKQRIYPVEYTEPVEETYVFNLTLPEGYTVSEKPANINYALPQNGGKFSYQVSINNNTVQLISKFSIKKILFAPEEYDSLKEFYSQIINKQNEQIVLKKL